ncbi:MAG TPA: tRNA lysidine(34) synthetase TilS [Burkholderiales bacterium]|nr:tRNA lysidine(34) synthetase TilS [Burkholderiales bacterium]
MASSRKPRSADPARAADAFLAGALLGKKHVVVALSGGVDSVVLLHVLRGLKARHGFRLSALHVHHGLSPNAAKWQRFCQWVCRQLKVPLSTKRVRVTRAGEGLEAAARKARYEAFRAVKGDAVALAHHLDDQAETVLLNLLRGAGRRGLSGMPARGRHGGKVLLRPLLEVPRASIEAYAQAHELRWIEDESNDDEALTRNFLRRRVAPLLEARFPRWREGIARTARLAARDEADASDLLREFLRARGLRAPGEARLVEMLKQLQSGGARTALRHDGKMLRVYRGRVSVEAVDRPRAFHGLRWKGEKRLAIPALGGVVTFARAPLGVDATLLKEKPFSFRLRSGGERLQPDPKRPRRTLKNLFQEAGVPPHERDRLPLLFCGDDLVWVPGLGLDARFQARDGALPRWQAKT